MGPRQRKVQKHRTTVGTALFVKQDPEDLVRGSSERSAVDRTDMARICGERLMQVVRAPWTACDLNSMDPIEACDMLAQLGAASELGAISGLYKEMLMKVATQAQDSDLALAALDALLTLLLVDPGTASQA